MSPKPAAGATSAYPQGYVTLVAEPEHILSRQEGEGWGAKVIDRLAPDLGRAFPEMTGLSARNLKYMRAALAVVSGISDTDITVIFDHEHDSDVGLRPSTPSD